MVVNKESATRGQHLLTKLYFQKTNKRWGTLDYTVKVWEIISVSKYNVKEGLIFEVVFH